MRSDRFRPVREGGGGNDGRQAGGRCRCRSEGRVYAPARSLSLPFGGAGLRSRPAVVVAVRSAVCRSPSLSRATGALARGPCRTPATARAARGASCSLRSAQRLARRPGLPRYARKPRSPYLRARSSRASCGSSVRPRAPGGADGPRQPVGGLLPLDCTAMPSRHEHLTGLRQGVYPCAGLRIPSSTLWYRGEPCGLLRSK